MELQEYLRHGKTTEDLKKEYHIHVKAHRHFPNLLGFKYDQIESPMNSPIVRESRGVILDSADNWNVVARGYDKFFNHGEPSAARIDWTSAKVLEKLDGTCCLLYYYSDDWRVATLGSPDASGPVGSNNKVFSQLFWYTFYKMGYDTYELHPDYTYIFELMTPENRVVVSHADYKLVLTGIRNRITEKELDIFDYEYDLYGNDIERVGYFPQHNHLKTVLETAQSINGLEQEGYVVVDRLFNRIKIKSPQYVMLHQMVDSLTKKKILDCVRTGEAIEVLAYFPSWQNEFDEVKVVYDAFVSKCEQEYELIKDIPVQKDFAFEALKTSYSAAMFGVRANKYTSFKEFFKNLHLDRLHDMLRFKGEQ